MQQILEGLARFQRDVWPRHRALFAKLAKNQEPKALFITCSDSRVVPNLLVQADPGDLFILRNAGNIVPAAHHGSDETAASVEYAVEALGVRDIVICGHSDCGAMKGILHPEKVAAMPSVASWVRHAEVAKNEVERLYPDVDDATKLELTVEQNVIAQVKNLLTHSFIRKHVENREVEIYGWVYDIRTGMVRGLNEEGTDFLPIHLEWTGSPDEKKLLDLMES